MKFAVVFVAGLVPVSFALGAQAETPPVTPVSSPSTTTAPASTAPATTAPATTATTAPATTATTAVDTATKAAEPEIQSFEEPEVSNKPTKPAEAKKLEGETMDEFIVRGRSSRVGINVFGDVSAALDFNNKPHSSFKLGALGLILTGDLNKGSKMLGEFVMENGPEGNLVLDLERLTIKTEFGKWQFWAGRDHADFGIWNQAYHHGVWLQPTVERPNAVRFEDDDGLLPIHWIGAYGKYTANVGDGKLILHGTVGNGRGGIVDDILAAGDSNEGKGVLFRVEAAGIGDKRLRYGAVAAVDFIAPQGVMVRPTLPNKKILEVIGNVFLGYRSSTINVITEGYMVAHSASGESWKTFDGFAMGSFTTGGYTPYVLLEGRTSSGGSDPFFHPLDAANGPQDGVSATAGVRYELSTWSTIRIEVDVKKNKDAKVTEVALANWAFGL
jgi:hypothetical protein